MSLREEMWKYEQITGESAEHVPIIKLGAFLDGYEMGLKALEQTGWIPVSERLPEEFQCVLVTTGSRVDVCTYLKGSAYWKSYVLAWMPLPKPYKESEDKE